MEDARPDETKEESGAITLDELARHYQDGLVTISEVLKLLPDSPPKRNALLFLDTATLWAEQAFNQHSARIARLKK